MCLDHDKLCKILLLVKEWEHKKKATKRQLLSVQGKLIWVSRVVRYSRLFVQRIIAESKKGESPDSWITLSSVGHNSNLQ